MTPRRLLVTGGVERSVVAANRVRLVPDSAPKGGEDLDRVVEMSLGLALAFVSAVAVNWAYTREHDAAATMPRFSARQPIRFVSLLLANRTWRIGFALETAGWLVYVAALRLAPLSLVQAVCASGIAVLALVSVRGDVTRLALRERAAVAIAVTGLVLLALSLVDTRQADHPPGTPSLAIWLVSLAAAAVVLAQLRIGLAAGPALGLAAGLFFAGGDISAKLVVYGGVWLLAVLCLIVFYALGTSVLQGAFQHGNALTGAGLATLATNAVPIAAGFVVFGEELPTGAQGTLQLASFASLVACAVLLARAPTSTASATVASADAGFGSGPGEPGATFPGAGRHGSGDGGAAPAASCGRACEAGTASTEPRSIRSCPDCLTADH